MIRLNNERAKIYLQSKIIGHFDSSEYKEGSYNDNWFVERCHDDYLYCNEEDGFDGPYLSFLIDGFLDDNLGIKLTYYFQDKQEWIMPSEDEYCDREIEYIDWAFANEPCSCSWDVAKYREEKEICPTGIHLKWHNNELSDWWKDCKDQILRAQDEIHKEREAQWNARSESGGSYGWTATLLPGLKEINYTIVYEKPDGK